MKACIRKTVIHEANLDAGIHKEVSIGPHQMRKLGASWSFYVDQDTDTVRNTMGFHAFLILIKIMSPRYQTRSRGMPI